MTNPITMTGIKDVEALETMPWEERRPAQSTYEYLALAAKAWPDKTAVYFLPTGSPDEDAVTLTFAQYFGRVTQAANMFHDFGVGPTDVVAILLPLLPQTHFSLWGAEAAGIASPINFLLSADQIADLLNASQAKALVALGPHPMLDIWEKVEKMKDRVPSLSAIFKVGGPGDEASGVYSFDETVAKYPADTLTSGRQIQPTDIASYFHTGGTTGSPKLARHTHEGEVYAAWTTGTMWGFGHDDTIISGLPLFHVGGAFACSLGPLTHGTSIVIPSPAGLRSPVVIANIWKLVEKFKMTGMGGIPTSLVAMNQVPVGDSDISSLRYCFSGGSAIAVQVEREISEKVGKKVAHIYGATEASLAITFTPADAPPTIGTCGTRLPYEELRVARMETVETTREPCETGEPGMVMAKGPNVFPGYLNPAQNKGTLSDDGWLITGDLGYLDKDGFLYLTGRAKDLIIRSGHNIDPSIIEEITIRHPAVAMAAAVGRPDEYAGELPVVYVQLNDGAQATPDEIRTYLEENITERPALPKEVVLVDAIPTTAVGKMFKPELRWDQAQKHFRQKLAYLEEAGLSLSVSVGESKARGTLCRVSLSGGPDVDRARIEADIAANLDKYQYISHEVIWA